MPQMTAQPPSLLRKAEEVRLETGPAKVTEDVQRLAQHDQAILDEAMDILGNEASEDEAARKHTTLDRLPSHEANVELVEKEKRNRAILAQAAMSDETVRQKWDEWERNIVELTWIEEDLETSIPSSTISSSAAPTAQGKQTQTHARALRVQIEALDDVHRAREQLVTPAMFEDVSDEEFAKFDRFLGEMADILAEIQRRNELFLQSRKDDPAVKEREHALQSLDLPYHKYREITRNLDEGFKVGFYNDLATIFLQFKEACKNWSRLRNQQIHSLSRSLQALSVGGGGGTNAAAPSSPPATPTPTEPAPAPTPCEAGVPMGTPPPSSPRQAPIAQAPTRKQPVGKSSLGLPAITSEWGFEDFQLPPPPPPGRQ
ncbi:hypothetical protein D9615_009568 [Tricholomella constricta]|uniref:ALIX V-shaped domain-containing protein n=1 Tax=Tricholomella constricta TaxID=117010 RepID=A0A8H5GV85_9AGAR|nr:hypothetical protein D9615_009568 [Tricholomella constricta]